MKRALEVLRRLRCLACAGADARAAGAGEALGPALRGALTDRDDGVVENALQVRGLGSVLFWQDRAEVWQTMPIF